MCAPGVSVVQTRQTGLTEDVDALSDDIAEAEKDLAAMKEFQSTISTQR